MTEEPISIPALPYRPRDPRRYQPTIGLIGCGAITVDHLRAYQAAGYKVAALCDVDQKAATARQQQFYPDAEVFTDFQELLTRDAIDVVDIATHPDVRAGIVEAALMAQKHVLSQKPFVLDLSVGRGLVELAEKRDVKLAVNQNGRWAPHFSYMRGAIAAGLIGDVQGVHMAVHWDHNWVCGTEFENVRHLILYDFAIHWFDMLTCFMGSREPKSVYATFTRSATQKARPTLLAEAIVKYEGAQASLVFDGDTGYGPSDTTYVTGSRGTLSSQGVDLNQQAVTLALAGGEYRPQLSGRWFPDGFHGTMGELLCAIEEGREPENGAADNLRSLALCFAAVASAERGEPVVPGTIERLPNPQ